MTAQRTASPAALVRELTVRTIAARRGPLLFTAANVYLALKVGLTFASSIPAAVISMPVLRYLRAVMRAVLQPIAAPCLAP